MTRNAINNSLWAVGLVLQCGLLALVFLRGVWARVPSFTVLLAFYPVRAALLFFLPGHIAADDYASLYSGLALAGLLLPIVVAAEIGWRIWRLRGRGRWGLWLTPVVAAAMAWGLWRVLPGKAPIPPDRVQLFGSMMMILLCGFAVAARVRGVLYTAVIGLAAFGVVDLLATTGKSFAAMHRDAAAFAGWSYASSGAYLLVVLFWMVALRPGARK